MLQTDYTSPKFVEISVKNGESPNFRVLSSKFGDNNQIFGDKPSTPESKNYARGRICGNLKSPTSSALSAAS